MDRNPNEGATGATTPDGMRDVPDAPGVYTGGGTPGTSSATSGGLTANTADLANRAADRAADLRDNAADKLGAARENAAEKFGAAREAASDRFGQIREKAHDLRGNLADRLEAGAERLRGGVSGTQGAAYAAAGSISLEADPAGPLANRLAGVAQGTADILRDADLQNLKAGIEKQVRDNPARTLLIAVGVGYILGKAFRR